MKRLLAWTAAAALSCTGAALMLVQAIRDARAQTPDEVVAPRDASKLPPGEMELIATKIREGDLRAMRKELPAARRAWDEARALGRGLWPAHEGVADSYARYKLHAEAEREYATAERLAPDKTREAIRLKRARNLRPMGRDAEALDLLLAVATPALAREIGDTAGTAELVARIVNHAAETPWLWYAVCQAHLKAGRRPAAAQALARYTIEVAPWDRALVDRALAFLRDEKLVDDALAVGRAYAKSTPEDVSIHGAIGDLCAQAGRTDEAVLAYSSLVDLRPIDADVRLHFARKLIALGRRDDARAQLATARKLKPDINVGAELASLEPQVVRIVMTWDTATDVDLYVTEPAGTRVYYQNKRGTGTLYADDTDGLGPETYTGSATGAYRIVARMHSGQVRTNVRITTIVRDGPPREHALVLERSGEEKEIAPLTVID